MTTLAHAQGGPRPADLAFHPGLQIHAIQAPRAEVGSGHGTRPLPVAGLAGFSRGER